MKKPWWARKIHSLRKSQGKTQEEISGMSGMDRHYLSGLENGHHVPRIDTLDRVLKALGARWEIREKEKK